MKKEVLHALGYEFDDWDEYMTEQHMQGSNVLSTNDFAAMCKREAVKKGFEIMSSTSEKSGWGWVYHKGDDSFDEHIFHTSKKNENEAVFACFAWILNKQP